MLRQRIIKGEYPPGEKIPPEPAIMGESDYSRATVQSAVRVLRDEGLLEVICGVGTYVTDPKDWKSSS